jgi:hypothetical protein
MALHCSLGASPDLVLSLADTLSGAADEEGLRARTLDEACHCLDTVSIWESPDVLHVPLHQHRAGSYYRTPERWPPSQFRSTR